MARGTAQTQTWRVRTWIRVVVVVGWLLLAWEQSDVIRRVARDEMPASEVRDGYLVLGLLAVAAVVLVFRPMLRINGGSVLVRNPLRTSRFRTSDVADVRIDSLGLVIDLVGGRRVRSIVFQGTAFRDEPRWFDVAEALTGARPVLSDYFPDEPWDDEEHDDN